MSREELVKMMSEVKGSYDDFVNSTVRWMEQDKSIQDAILAKIKENSLSTTDDITAVLWEHLGIGEPLELIDDEPPHRKIRAAML